MLNWFVNLIKTITLVNLFTSRKAVKEQASFESYHLGVVAEWSARARLNFVKDNLTRWQMGLGLSKAAEFRMECILDKHWRSYGLCNLLSQMLPHGLSPRALFQTWPEYSGIPGYPIKDPAGIMHPQEIFEATNDKWAGEYGAARVRLMEHSLKVYVQAVESKMDELAAQKVEETEE